MSENQSTGEHRFEDVTVRERVAANPRPALLWLAGVAVLLALEFGRFVGGARRFVGAVWFMVEGVADTPASVQGAVAGSLGPAAGLVAFVLTALVLLAVVGVVVNWLFVPASVVSRYDLDVSASTEDLLDAAVVAGVIGLAALVLVATPLGGAVDAVVGALSGVLDRVGSLPTLTSRETIPNQGYQAPDGSWVGPFLGLSPALAWALRVVLVYAYAFVWLAWLLKGYDVFRTHYREADWTPRDDSLDRLRGHTWGMFGVVVVFMFVVMALFAPALSPYTAEENLYSPYENEFEYHDGDGVQTILHGDANIQTRSQGGDANVGLLQYDQYDRFHPFGTNQDGKDLFTFLAYGARVSLVVGLLATVLGAVAATVLALMTAYYKGALDLMTVIASDSIISMPRFLVALLLSVLFTEANHPIATIYDGGLLLALIFAGTGWPFLWRAVRGPSLQVAEQEWIDAARSYGQRPAATMRKHMAPYIAGYMLVYASLSLGGVIIGVAALSFLGFGIQAPTPEWGRAVNEGRPFVSTASWHIATIPGLLIVLVVTAFNALGDGVRDAIDPQSQTDEGAAGAAATGGGG